MEGTLLNLEIMTTTKIELVTKIIVGLVIGSLSLALLIDLFVNGSKML